MVKKNECLGCEYFNRTELKSGECHRNPPMVDFKWPKVRLADCCGEWHRASSSRKQKNQRV